MNEADEGFSKEVARAQDINVQGTRRGYQEMNKPEVYITLVTRH